jgi:formate-dependent nitrite reductase membrane component NrfD
VKEEDYAVLSTLVAGYLFLGGAGAGALFILLCMDLFSAAGAKASEPPPHHPMGVRGSALPNSTLANRPFPNRTLANHTLASNLYQTGSIASLLALMSGVFCLLADLGRFDRLINLFIYPSLSYLSIGAYALTLLLVGAATLAGLWNLGAPHTLRIILRGAMPMAALFVKLATLLLCAVVMLYTGLLLQSMDTVLFWASPFVPVLFVLSSLSTGMALLLGTWYLTGAGSNQPATNQPAVNRPATNQPATPKPGATYLPASRLTPLRTSTLFTRLVLVDSALIVLEALCVLLFFITSGDSDVRSSIQSLVSGEYRTLFWAGFVACGLVIPLLLEPVMLGAHIRSARGTPSALTASAVFAAPTALTALVALAVLIGGLSLRLCVMQAGLQPLALGV